MNDLVFLVRITKCDLPMYALVGCRRAPRISSFFYALLLWFTLQPLNLVAQDEQTTETRIVYPKKTELDFEGLQIEGELRSPGEFYFEQRPKEKFDSLVKRRKNFHHQMLRDSVMIR